MKAKNRTAVKYADLTGGQAYTIGNGTVVLYFHGEFKHPSMVVWVGQDSEPRYALHFLSDKALLVWIERVRKELTPKSRPRLWRRKKTVLYDVDSVL